MLYLALSLAFSLSACPVPESTAGPLGPELDDLVTVIPAPPQVLEPEWDGQLLPPTAPIPTEPPVVTLAPVAAPPAPTDAKRAEYEAALASVAAAEGPAATP